MSMLILPQGRGAANIDCGNAVPHTLWRADLGVPGVDALTGRPCSQRHGTYRISSQLRDIGFTTNSDTGGTTQACGVSIPATGDFGAIVGCSIFWVGAVTAYSADNNLYSRIVSTSLHNGNYGGGFRAGLSNSQTPFIRLHLNGAWETVYSTTFVPYSKLTTIVIDIVADGVVFWVNGVAEHITTTAAPLQTVGVNLKTCSANIGATANEYTGHRYAKCIAAGIFTGGLPEHVKRDGREMLNPRDDIIWLDAGGGGVTGSFAATESDSDTAAVTGQVIVQGSFAATESGSDTAVASAKVIVSGTLAASESGQDSAAIAGKIAVTGSLTANESGSDTAAIYAAQPPISGSFAATESGSDTAYITNIAVTPSPPAVDSGSGGGGGGSWRTKWKHKKELRDLIDKALSIPPEELEEVVEKALQPEPIAKLLVRGKISTNLEEVKEEVAEDFHSVLRELEQKLQTLSKSREETSWQETLKRIEEEEEEEVVVKHLLDYNTAVLINNNVWELLCRYILTSALHAD